MSPFLFLKGSRMPHLTDTKKMELSLEEAKKEFPFDFDEKGKPHDKVRKFPHGLEIRLGNAALKKLGMKSSDFNLEGKLAVYALVTVERIRHEEVLGEDPEMSVELQITELSVSDPQGSLEDLMFKS